jgi:hypothetical protein
MLIFRKAFALRQKSVVIRDGRKFTIEYSTRMSKTERKEYEVAWVSPDPNSRVPHNSLYVPCGWFAV